MPSRTACARGGAGFGAGAGAAAHDDNDSATTASMQPRTTGDASGGRARTTIEYPAPDWRSSSIGRSLDVKIDLTTGAGTPISITGAPASGSYRAGTTTIAPIIVD
jgi:hypothetical protein